MINLAGKREADKYIQEELLLAKIPLVRGKLTIDEVPYTITGRIGNWTFNRGWYYWRASAPDGEGLPLEIAAQLHEKEYPITGELLRYGNEAKIYGDSVRATGHCGCPHPRECTKYFDEIGRRVIIDPSGKKEKERDSLLETHKEILTDSALTNLKQLRYLPLLEGTDGIRAVIDSYHVDTQLGLNELARVIRKREIDILTQLGI